MKNTMIAMVMVLALVATASAVSYVDWVRTENIDGLGNTAYTLMYNPNPGADFLNLRLTAVVTSGTGILDPLQSSNWADCSASTPIDTFVNTCYSAMGWGSAGYNFNAYQPTGPGHDDPPTTLLDWSVFDAGDGDTDEWGPYVMARLITSADTEGTVTFWVFDRENIEWDPYGETFEFEMTPEPATMAMLSLGALALIRRRRR